eukprot:289603-Amphidinium_carterae.1
MAVYGHPTDYHLTDEIGMAALEQLRQCGLHNSLLVGDFNTDPEDLEFVHQLCTEQWERCHDPTIPTCQAPGATGTSIDACYISPTCASH